MHQCKPYRRQPVAGGSDGETAFNAQFITKLIKNYRNHPNILQIPNELFYEGELEACADQALREKLCKLDFLPKKNVPVIFHAVSGQEKREEKSPSYFNAEEISQVRDYVDKLLKARGVKVEEKDIGIIAPYRKQVTSRALSFLLL